MAIKILSVEDKGTWVQGKSFDFPDPKLNKALEELSKEQHVNKVIDRKVTQRDVANFNEGEIYISSADQKAVVRIGGKLYGVPLVEV